MPGLQHILAVALLVTQVSGCALLDLLFGFSPEPPFDPDDPFPFPTAEATFGTGMATLQLEDETIVLDDVVADSSFGEYGYSVTWTNDAGWYLQLSGFSEELGFPSGGSFLSLHHIEDGRHLTVLDPTRCLTTTDQVDADGIAGSATCRGLEWIDFFASNSSGFSGFPQPIEGMQPFDAEISFEAH